MSCTCPRAWWGVVPPASPVHNPVPPGMTVTGSSVFVGQERPLAPDLLPSGVHADDCPCSECALDVVVAERDALRAEVERLRGALRRYGNHDGRGRFLPDQEPCLGRRSCTCGLDAALSKEPTP